MRDVCCCGRSGDGEDRLPIYLSDSDWGLMCPTCGQVDRLAWLREAARRAILLEVARHLDALGRAA